MEATSTSTDLDLEIGEERPGKTGFNSSVSAITGPAEMSGVTSEAIRPCSASLGNGCKMSVDPASSPIVVTLLSALRAFGMPIVKRRPLSANQARYIVWRFLEPFGAARNLLAQGESPERRCKTEAKGGCRARKAADWIIEEADWMREGDFCGECFLALENVHRYLVLCRLWIRGDLGFSVAVAHLEIMGLTGENLIFL